MTAAEVEEVKRHFNVVAESLRSDVRLVVEGLAANTERLDRIDFRLDRIDVRLDRVELRLDGVEVRLDGVEVRLDRVERELGGLKNLILPLVPRSDN